jgi:hypothetical protein
MVPRFFKDREPEVWGNRSLLVLPTRRSCRNAPYDKICRITLNFRMTHGSGRSHLFVEIKMSHNPIPRGECSINAHNQIEGLPGKPINEYFGYGTLLFENRDHYAR